MIAFAPIVGYLVGSLPTAGVLGRLWGVDLRSEGTGNPGANNALRVAGLPLAALVLGIEMTKGVLAVVFGLGLGGDLGASLAGLGAIAGNVYNVWYRFGGGKGLAISGGVILAIWPLAFPVLLGVIAVAALLTRSSGKAALYAVGVAVLLSVMWGIFQLPETWGVGGGGELVLLSLGLVLLLAPKHLRDARNPVRSPDRRERR